MRSSKVTRSNWKELYKEVRRIESRVNNYDPSGSTCEEQEHEFTMLQAYSARELISLILEYPWLSRLFIEDRYEYNGPRARTVSLLELALSGEVVDCSEDLVRSIHSCYTPFFSSHYQLRMTESLIKSYDNYTIAINVLDQVKWIQNWELISTHFIEPLQRKSLSSIRERRLDLM